MDKDDYKEYMYRAGESEDFKDIKASLNTMHDINDIKLRSDDVELPDPSKRFGLDEKRVKLKNFSDGSYLFLAFIAMLFGLGFYFIS